MRNYRFPVARYGFTFAQLERIALRLALRTGRARLMWVNRKGRAHIIAEGAGGYRHVKTPDSPYMSLVGHVPGGDSIDWQAGGLCEVTPVCGETRPTPDNL